MIYIQPVGGGASDPYVTGVPGVTPGSIPPGEAIEHPQREIINVIVAAGLTPSGADLTQLLEAIKKLSNPVGTVIHVATSSAPFGYLKANGAAVSRTTYSALFALIGITFGAGDGSTTFNLPDLRGEFLRALDDGRGVDTGRALGSAQAESKIYDSMGQLASPNRIAASITNPDSDTTDSPATYQISNQGSASYTRHAYGVRPRNIALLACIKF